MRDLKQEELCSQELTKGISVEAIGKPGGLGEAPEQVDGPGFRHIREGVPKECRRVGSLRLQGGPAS